MNFKIYGTEIYISFYCFAAFALFYNVDKPGLLTASLLSAFAHEAGHLFAIRVLSKKKPKRIIVTPFGARILNKKLWELPHLFQIIIYISGPFVNLLVFSLIYVLKGKVTDTAAVNLALGLFNLLPVLPLDGGNALKCFVSIFKNQSADVYTEIISAVILFPTAVMGFIYLFNKRGNYSLFALTVYLCILFLNRNGVINLKRLGLNQNKKYSNKKERDKKCTPKKSKSFY